MKPGQKTATLYLVYLLLGALVGVVFLHPLTMTIMWLEFVAGGTEGPGFLEFMRSRFWLGFLPKQLHMGIVFAILGGVIGLGFGFTTRAYMKQVKSLRFFMEEHKRTVPEIIRGGETDRVEFKSSVRWDIQESRINRGLEKVIAKTIAGFFNSKGGELIIGVADDGEILGLRNDYQTLKHPNPDGFERTVNDVIKKALGGDLCPLLHFAFVDINGEDVCMITAETAPRPVYLNDGNNDIFYVRVGNSTRQMDVKEALDYANSRWQKGLL